MRESVPYLTQTHCRKWRRQRKLRREARLGRLKRHYVPPYLSYVNTYNYSHARLRGQTRGRCDSCCGGARIAVCLGIGGLNEKVNQPMAERPRHILICSCEDTMSLDGETVRRGCRDSVVIEGRQFCRAELDRVRKVTAGGEAVVIACTQEAPLFNEVAEESGAEAPTFINIRETGGWAKDAAKAGPKMAALIAATASPASDVSFVSLSSDGVTLLYGKDERAIEAAELLKDHLDVT